MTAEPHGQWNTLPELPANVFRALNHPADPLDLTVVIATVDGDGRPHTAPFGSVRAVTPRVLRFACDRGHGTYANLRDRGHVVICALLSPDIAVSVRGRARVIKEEMGTTSTDAVVEIDVDEVKNDMLIGAAIESSVRFSLPDEMVEFVERYIAEALEA